MNRSRLWSVGLNLYAVGLSVAILTGCGSGETNTHATPNTAGGVPTQPAMPVTAAGAQMQPGAAGIAPGAPGVPMGGMAAGGAMAGGAMSAGGAAPASR